MECSIECHPGMSSHGVQVDDAHARTKPFEHANVPTSEAHAAPAQQTDVLSLRQCDMIEEESQQLHVPVFDAPLHRQTDALRWHVTVVGHGKHSVTFVAPHL